MAHVAVIPGPPQGMGSKRAYCRGGKAWVVNDNPDGLAAWKTRCTDALYAVRPEKPYDCAVTVRIDLYVARPKAHYGTGRNAHILKATAPKFPGTGRDIDKVARAVLDCASAAGWWRDDSRVCRLSVRRHWADLHGERTEIRLIQMEEADA